LQRCAFFESSKQFSEPDVERVRNSHHAAETQVFLAALEVPQVRAVHSAYVRELLLGPRKPNRVFLWSYCACQWSDLRTNRLDNNLTDHAFRGTHWSWKSPTSLKTLSPGVCAMQPAESDLLWLLDKTTARDHMSDTQHNSVERIVGKYHHGPSALGFLYLVGSFWELLDSYKNTRPYLISWPDSARPSSLLRCWLLL